ncbi:unnamed protein product, partial [Mesorhabditis spiculigera]
MSPIPDSDSSAAESTLNPPDQNLLNKVGNLTQNVYNQATGLANQFGYTNDNRNNYNYGQNPYGPMPPPTTRPPYQYDPNYYKRDDEEYTTPDCTILPFPMAKGENDYRHWQQHHSPTTSSLSGNLDPWEMPRSNLIIDYENKLGSGAFCNVFKGRIVGEAPVVTLQPSLRTNGFRDCEVAVKMLPSFADDIARSDFMQEINFMKSLRYHQHLVSMLGFVSDRRSPMLVVEFCGHGDLLHYIRERKELIRSGVDNASGVTIKEIVSFAWQIAQGLEYLNSVGCIHRDVAARNVLVADNHVCKIGDFGLCRLTDSLLYTARGGRLPLKWMAPESLSTFEYSFKSDVWSYGILLWELFSLGEVPFAGVQTTDLLLYIRAGNRPDRPAFCTDEVWTILMACWHLEADKRPTFTDLGRKFGGILEIATENYGYLIPTARISTDSHPQEENSEISNV